MLAAIRVGTERESFALLYAEHHARLVRLAFLLTSDAGRSEEVVADAFVKVWRRWRSGDVRDVGAYLRTTVVHGARSGLRRRYLERRVAGTADGSARGVLIHEDVLVERDAVWQAIEALPDGQRRVVVLRFYEQFDVAETASLLGVTEGTVKSQTSRAMDRLGAVLEGVR